MNDGLDALRIKFKKLMADAESVELWFRCPKCGASGLIDAEQAMGLVSIACPSEGCDFHETGQVHPIILSRNPLAHDQQFTVGGEQA